MPSLEVRGQELADLLVAEAPAEGVRDPLGIALGALAKLREHGYPGYIPQPGTAGAETGTGPDYIAIGMAIGRSIAKSHITGEGRTEAPELSDPAAINPSQELGPKELALIDRHMHRVKYEALKVLNTPWGSREELDELMADGYLALVRASINFDPAKLPEDATGASYFIESISGGIRHGIRGRRGRSPTGGVIDVKPGVMTGIAHSLDAPLSAEDDGNHTLGDIVSAGDSQEEIELRVLTRNFQRVLATLPEREQEVFMRHVVHGETQVSIAEGFGYSQMHISRIARRAAATIGEALAGHVA